MLNFMTQYFILLKFNLIEKLSFVIFYNFVVYILNNIALKSHSICFVWMAYIWG